ncbi:MAG: glycosyltransferase family 1 protein [Clostridia bacterium]|nr:glycosyltransferase family 1 protein [Clostridia bacterium]
MNIYRNIDRSKVQFDFLTHGIGEDYFEEEIKQLGGNIYRLPFIKDYKNYKKQMGNFWKENQGKYQTIHIHACYAMSYFDAKQAKKNKIKNIIVHSHSANTNIKKRKIVQDLLKSKLTKIANYRLTCSKEAAEWMFSKKIITNEQYKKINNAIHVEDYQFDLKKREKVRKKLRLEGKFVVGHVGRLSAAKNHMFLLEVFKEIVKKQDNAVLLLVGDGELKESIIQKAQKLGILEKVILLGNSNKVSDFLQAMDVFVFPSLFEGFGLAVLEAQITGLPCLIANHITKEVKVTDLVEFISLQEKPENWAKKILLKKIDKRENRVEEVKEKKYDIIDVTKELQDFYLEIN